MDLITFENGVAVLEPKTASAIAVFEKQMKSIKEQEDLLKRRIMQEMEANGIIKIETPDMVINYIAETDRETFEQKTFKRDYPELFDEYVKMSPVKASIRIKVK